FSTYDVAVWISWGQFDHRMLMPAIHRSGRDTGRRLRHRREATTDIVLSTERLIDSGGLVFVFHEQTIAFHFVRLKIAAAVEVRRIVRIGAGLDRGLRKWTKGTRAGDDWVSTRVNVRGEDGVGHDAVLPPVHN